MNYTQLTEDDVHAMLARIGAASVDDLFSPIEAKYRFKGRLNVGDGLSEPELLTELRTLADKNVHTGGAVCFLGAGIYDHFIPSVVDALAGQSEFVTAYTPYQAEASQGSLQAFFEYQTMICQLTGMDVSNASLYELASATAEAVLMAHGITGRRKVLWSAAVHPDCHKVLATYTRQHPVEAQVLPHRNGVMDLDLLRRQINDDTAAVIVQAPNFFGCVEDVEAISRLVHAQEALLIVAVDPISCGLLKRPGDLGADIVVAEGQGLGIPTYLGGPGLGIMACREKFMRKMPGRIVGQTTGSNGRTAYCLALQTREQHIKREKATSNVCTNQGLLALRAAVYLAALGRKGIREVASQSFDKAHYAAERIAGLTGYELRFPAPFFKEFVVRTDRPVQGILAHCRDRGLMGGVALERWFPDMKDCFMVAVTERRTKAEIDQLVTALSEA